MTTLAMDIIRPRVQTKTKTMGIAAENVMTQNVVVGNLVPDSYLAIAGSLTWQLIVITVIQLIKFMQYWQVVFMWLSVDMALIYLFVRFFENIVGGYW